MSTRDDFTKKTVDILARRAGGKCSICKCSTYGPNDNPHGATNIGQAAHISAAAEGGPRYDPTMSPEVRKSLKNGIWLCSNCHDNIDRNPERFSVPYLQRIKKEAETSAREQLGVPRLRSDQEDHLTTAISSIAIVEVRKARASLASHHGSDIPKSETWEILSAIDFIDFNREGYLPQVGDEVLKLLFHLAGHEHDPEIYLEIIRYVNDIVNSFVTEWREEEVEKVCELVKKVVKNQSVRSSVYQTSLALIKDIAVSCSNNICIRKIINKYFQQVTEGKTRATIKTNVFEETDNVESDEEEYKERGIPSPKRRRGLGQEENETLQYINKMLQLTTPTTEKDKADVEQEIMEMGFEPNIL